MPIKRSLLGNQTRDVGPLAIRASLQPGSVNVEKRTVNLVWSTGAAVLRSTWDEGQFWEELSMDARHVRLDRLNSGAPFLADHNGRSVVATHGVVESARLEGGNGVATVRFAAAGIDPDTDKLFEKVRDGIVKNVSVGYRIHKMEKVETGEAKIPTFRATDWQPYEISAVAMGADAGAGFRSADTNPNPCNFISQEITRMDPEEIKRLAAEAEKVANAQRAEAVALEQRAVTAERERISGITSAFRSFGESAQKHAPKLAEMLKGDTTLDAARAYVLEELAQASDALTETRPSGIVRGADDRDQFVRGVSDALLQRVPAVVTASQKKLAGFEKIGDGGQFRGMRLSDVARLCAERNGHNLKGIYNMERVIQLALTGRDGYATGSDFPVLFEDIARKSMQAGYQTQSDTWRRWISTTSVSDFRDHSIFMKGTFGGLPVVLPGAEYQNLQIPDGAKRVINTETRGGIIALGRHAIVNDDLGFLTSAASEFGGSAANQIEISAYELLAENSGLGPTMSDTEPYFHTNRANVATGAALSAANLALDRAHMRKQMDVSGNRAIDLSPRIMLIALPLEGPAMALNQDQYTQGVANTFQQNNAARNMFSDIVTKPVAPVLTGTKRYLFTEDKGAFVCVFGPDGEGPALSSEQGFRTDGVSYKVRIDFKVQAGDPKKAVYNAGT